jgi:hypothetical protein
LCKQQAKVIQHHENIHVRIAGQGEARQKIDLNLAVFRHMIV